MVFLGTLTLIAGIQLAAPAQGQHIGSVTQTDHFTLRSDPRTALFHFLIDWAAADADEWPPYALPLTERNDWRTILDQAEQREWSVAIETYRATIGRSLVFDAGLIAVRGWAAGAAATQTVPPSEQPLADALTSVLPIYERHWWASHHERNQRWIDAVANDLDLVEEEMIARFEAAYGGRWPTERIPIDIVVYANDVGAYSTAGRLTISSVNRGNQMPQALEMVFHEASHVDEMERPLRRAVDEGFSAVGGEAPDRFWHDMIFFTSGEITRLALASRGENEYQHYGSFGVYRRGERWSSQLPAFEQYWRPFLESRQTENRHEAMAAVARQLLRSQ